MIVNYGKNYCIYIFFKFILEADLQIDQIQMIYQRGDQEVLQAILRDRLQKNRGRREEFQNRKLWRNP